MPDAVDIHVCAGYVVARLSRPPANPLGPALLAGLDAAADAVEDSEARALVISSTLNGFFAAGADIKHMRGLDGAGFADYGVHMRRVYDRLASLDALTIAAIDGFALGGGLELALACSMRIGSTRARLGVPEIKLGLIPGAGGTQRLPRLIGRSRALDLLITGRSVPGSEAHVIGLLDRLVPEGSAERAAIELATELASASLPAISATVRCVDAAAVTTLEQGIAFEAAEEQELFERGDAQEGIAAFVERRVPRFGGPAGVPT